MGSLITNCARSLVLGVVEPYPLLPLASILLLGVCSQWLAWKMRWPAILTLLGTGLLAGPVTGWLDPDRMVGELLHPMVALGVAVILFEGGLNLRMIDLREPDLAHSVWRLVLLGSLVTWAGATAAAIVLLGLSFEVALLLGAVLVVTGPTVILPMLRQVGLGGRVGSLLRWEGMLNDPMGAVLALLVFEGIRSGSLAQAGVIAAGGVLRTLVIGVIGALAVGWPLARCLRRYWIPDHLQAPLVLGLVLLLFALSDRLQPQSGLLSVTLLGMYLAHQKGLELSHLMEFKENLSVLLISILFITLTARLKWESLMTSQARWFLFVVVVIFCLRPAAVLIATLGSGLSWRERLLLACIGPRGIVAAAVASVFALELGVLGYPRAEDLVTITFLVIAANAAFSGLLAGPLSRLLGLTSSGLGTLLLVGSHEPARALARLLHDEGVEVCLVDSSAYNVALATLEGLSAHQGDILSEALRLRLDIAGVATVIALTPNEQVNTLAVLRYRQGLGRSHVFRLCSQDQNPGAVGRQFSRLTQGEFEQAWEQGWRPEVLELQDQHEATSSAAPLFVLREDGSWEVVSSDSAARSRPGDRVLALTPPPNKDLGPDG
ncbi:MAG: cation:proton antiporter [Vulcanimicrobiota bacterium]